MNDFEELDRQKNLLLTNIFEPEDNSLQLEISITDLDDVKEFTVNEINLGLVREITNNNTNIYKVFFPYYIAYSVVNESYDDNGLSEIYKGKSLRIYEKSNFLDYLKCETFATDEYPGKFIHYQIVTLNHIINVASQEEPVIEKIK